MVDYSYCVSLCMGIKASLIKGTSEWLKYLVRIGIERAANGF